MMAGAPPGNPVVIEMIGGRIFGVSRSDLLRI